MMSSSEEAAVRDRRRAAEMSIGTVSAHFRRDAWPRRVPDTDVEPLEAWHAAAPIHYPHALRGAVARLHEPTETILIARQGCLVTAYPLSNRPRDERIYIRDQVSDR